MNTSLTLRTNSLYEEAYRVALTGVDGTALSNPERKAVVLYKTLQVLNQTKVGTDFVAGRVLEEIDRENLYAVHPEGYSSTDEGATHHGMSGSEASDVRTLWRVIAPKMEALGYDPIDTVASIGYAKFRQLIPVLSQLIEPKANVRDSVRSAVEEILSKNRGNVDRAIIDAVELGYATTREIRQTLRPVRTPAIEVVELQRGKKRYVVASVSLDQLDMLRNLMKDHIDISQVNLDHYLPAQVPVLRSIIDDA